jgi:hypothetical protein
MDDNIEIEIQFFNAEDGGRRQLPNLKAGSYRPHFRVPIDPTLLGVEFIEGPLLIQPNIPFKAIVRPLYRPSVDYSTLTEGTHFDFVEGPNVVGHGVVLRCI